MTQKYVCMLSIIARTSDMWIVMQRFRGVNTHRLEPVDRQQQAVEAAVRLRLLIFII